MGTLCVPELPECRPYLTTQSLLQGTTLLRADLLGFSSLKTYAPTPTPCCITDSYRSLGG